MILLSPCLEVHTGLASKQSTSEGRAQGFPNPIAVNLDKVTM
jgi:hypothetical protein